MAIIESLTFLYSRDIQKIVDEVEAYSTEDVIWKTDTNVPNSSGTLALHLCGNLQHFIGAVLGETGYVRQRDKEFNDRNVPREELVALIQETKNVVLDTLNKLSADGLDKTYPLEVMGKDNWKIDTFLLHLLAHLGYHVGQMNYHRRILDK